MAYQLLRRYIPRDRYHRSTSLSYSSSPSPAPSPSPSPSTNPEADEVITSVVTVLTNYKSKARWATLLAHYPHGFTPQQVSQILLQIRRNFFLASGFFRFTITNGLTSHDVNSLSVMIHLCARARRKSRALSLIRTAIRVSESLTTDPTDINKKKTNKKLSRPAVFEALVSSYRSCDSAPFVFDVLIGAYLELNKIDTCLEIVHILKSSGISLGTITCNSLVSRVTKHRGFDSGYGLYKELFHFDSDVRGGASGRSKVRPNVETFNGMMLCCYHEGMVDKAEELWVEMMSLGCKPNTVSYNILMAAYVEEGEMDRAGMLWEEMGVQEVKRDAVSYNTVIGGWCKIGEMGKAEKLYREMEMSEIESTCITYQHMVTGHCKAGDVDSGLMLLKNMYRKGFSPDGSTIDLVISGLCDSGEVMKALDLFRAAMKEANFVARRSSYEVLIKGLCEVGEMDVALKMQAQMVGRGFKPDSDLYLAFINGFMKLGKIEMAVKLREEMVDTQGVGEELVRTTCSG